ncbi:MAG: DUF2207 domain-containing protein [Oscillospiraceae bacterium]
MKKTALLTALLVCLLTLPTAAANQVSSMDIEAVVYADGSLYVTQTWAGSFDEGTENFIPMHAPDYLTISDLQVTDINGTYETVSDWNVDWDFAQKANRCGVVYTDTGYEICFGISEYGQNRYAIEYRLDNAVGGYTDWDGVNFRFVNDEMTTTPTDVTVTIRLADGTPLTDEIADIWGFGFPGQVAFSEGAIFAYTETPLTADNHVTILLALQKGILAPTRVENDSFEAVKSAAMEGSDYDTGGGSTLGGIVMMVVGLLATVGVIVVVSKIKKGIRQKKMQNFSDQFGYFRDIPNGGNVAATYALGRQFEVCEDGAILATGMLRLIDLGCLTPVTQETVGAMGKTSETVNLRLVGGNSNRMDEYDEYLYTVLEGAAGMDGILQAKELERFAEKNDSLLRNYINKYLEAGKAYLNGKHCLKRWELPAKFSYLTDSGEKELGELMGFKKYLEDFSLIAERGVKELPIWKEMLSYAMLFGIADRVAEQIKTLYPNLTVELDTYHQSLYTATSYHYLLYRNMRNAEERREQAQRSSGGGGFASIGGGGGSIGGGSGGGSR